MNDKLKNSITAKAQQFASNAHHGQFYDNYDYTFHLQLAANVAVEHDLCDDVIVGCWLHDTMEDCGVSYQTIKSEFGENVAEIVFAVTDEMGRNRKERKMKTYPKIVINELALQVKLCDRIANFSYALKTKSRHLAMYRKEYPEFRDILYSATQSELTHKLWDLLDELNM